MNLRRIISDIVVAAVSAGLLVSCVDEMTHSGQVLSEELSFSASLDGAQAKSVPVTMLSGSAGVTGYRTASDGTSESLFTCKEFTFSGSTLHSEGSPVYWKDIAQAGGTLNVYAYAPLDISGAVFSADGYAFSYVVPSSPDDQADIITAVAENVPGDYGQPVSLAFSHALTAVRFKMDFDCTVKSLSMTGVKSAGRHTIGGTWDVTEGSEADFTVSFGDSGRSFSKGEFILYDEDSKTSPDEELVFMMIPQTFDSDSPASVSLTYLEGSQEKTLTASLAGRIWKPGKMITCTLSSELQKEPVRMDLAAGDISIDENTYSGYVFNESYDGTIPVTGRHEDSNVYYVYQSTKANPTGEYPRAMYDANTTWADFITNGGKPFGEALEQGFVEQVIEAWDNKAGTAGAAVNAGRAYTDRYIHVSGNLICNLTIDNIYSRYSGHKNRIGNNPSRTTGSVGFVPTGTGARLIINMLGDNRLTCVHYKNEKGAANELIFEGTGSLTVADADFYTATNSDTGTGYYSNHFNSAIGASDAPDGSEFEQSWGIVVNSGVLFAGTTKAENSSAIGGGGNGVGFVTINGGNVTAVATTTGTAIGGGIGFGWPGGEGVVEINGGNVFAYNFANSMDIPSAAIGGGGSMSSAGNKGTVTVTGGNVYAQTALGTAIGGGSSQTRNGGEAVVNISGGNIIAKSLAEGDISAGAGIGGGTGCSGGEQSDQSVNVDGGKATINISGSPVIRTGSVGGGRSGHPRGNIGTADITVAGGDIQAQFVMAASVQKGAVFSSPSFTMTGGLIRNSHTDDEEFYHIQDFGGAVYMEDGKFIMTGGRIRDCSAETGGAIYIKQGGFSTVAPLFRMSGGLISACEASGMGGAVYLAGGRVELGGDAVIEGNVAKGGNGGGICVLDGSFVMDGSAGILRNSSISSSGAGGSGGGVYVSSASDVTVDIKSGRVIGNTSERLGGGICVVPAESNKAEVTIGTEAHLGEVADPDISGNHTLLKGGGLYAEGAAADVTIWCGSIMGNTTSSYVPNEDIANEGGMVTLHGGDVTHVTVTFHANDGTGASETQNIVTATNSRITPPSFVRQGYDFAGWNTREDGYGTVFSDADFEKLNITAPLELYAVWTLR